MVGALACGRDHIHVSVVDVSVCMRVGVCVCVRVCAQVRVHLGDVRQQRHAERAMEMVNTMPDVLHYQ